MKVVLFEDDARGMSPLTDTTAAYELFFGDARISDIWLSRFSGFEVQFAGRWAKPSFKDDSLLLVNSLALIKEDILEKAINDFLRGAVPEGRGMVEGKRLVYAYVPREDAEAIMPFLGNLIDEQAVAAIGQKVMPIITTHTIYDELLRRNQPKVLIDTAWEFLARSLEALKAKTSSPDYLVSRSAAVRGSKIEGNAAVFGSVLVVNSAIRDSIIVGPAKIENSIIENSYVGRYTVISNARVKGLIGDLCLIAADVLGAKVGSGSSVLRPLQKDIRAGTRWGAEGESSDLVDPALKAAFKKEELAPMLSRLQWALSQQGGRPF